MQPEDLLPDIDEDLRRNPSFLLGRAEERTAALLRNIGDPGNCKGCTRQIFWVRHKNGKAVPYDADGTNHFITCPQAANFKKAGR